METEQYGKDPAQVAASRRLGGVMAASFAVAAVGAARAWITIRLLTPFLAGAVRQRQLAGAGVLRCTRFPIMGIGVERCQKDRNNEEHEAQLFTK